MAATERMQSPFKGLPPAERERLRDAFTRLTQSLKAEAEPLSESSRTALFRAVDGAILEWITLLGSEKPSLAALEKRNTANRLAQWHEAMLESFATAELETAGISRQQLAHWRKQRKLIALRPPVGRGFIYPAWEFDQDARPFAVIPEIATAAEEAQLDPLSLHRLMVLGGTATDGPLAAALKGGRHEYVVAAVRASGAQGS